jgi:hypothetical protein
MSRRADVTNELQDISNGLAFILEHFFSSQNEPMWPGTVSSVATKGAQHTVDGNDRAMLYFEGALRKDCKISAYLKYEDLVKNGTLPSTYRPKPTLLFIDLDLSNFGEDKDKLDSALDTTLRNIKEHLNGATPTVLWTGGGYHIYLALDPEAVPVFEEMSEFARFEDPSLKFLRYAERCLTNGKSDPCHSPSFKSCMLRIPNSINSKYAGEEEAKVEIVQRWNRVRARPTRQFMIVDFHTYLVQERIDEKVKEAERMQRFSKSNNSNSGSSNRTTATIVWIEKLLQTPIADYRKNAIALILAPYLLNIRNLSLEQAYATIIDWLNKCEQLRPLQPSRRDVNYRVKLALERAQKTGILPMRLDTVKDKSPELHEILSLGGSVRRTNVPK